MLPLYRERASHELVLAVVGRRRDQRHELLLGSVEHRAHLDGLHPRLEVVEEWVVRIVVRGEALDVAALQFEHAVEPGLEGREIRVAAGRRPGLLRVGGHLRRLGGSSVGTLRAFSQSRRATRMRLASSES